jgi:hypothetical protein
MAHPLLRRVLALAALALLLRCPARTAAPPRQARGTPVVLTPDEAVAGSARVQVRCYVFEDKAAKPAGRGASRPPGLFPGAPRIGVVEESKKGRKLNMVPLERLGKDPSVRLAEQVRPLRLVVIAANFPYRQQVEEFRAKLRRRSAAEVLRETSPEKRGTPLPSFRFLGVEVQRREVDVAGRPRTPFATLDVSATFRPWLLLTGKRFEKDDPKYAPVIFPGLVMPKLLTFPPPGLTEKEKESEDISLYPRVEDRLAKLQATIEALRKTAGGRAPPGRFAADDFDPFKPGKAPAVAPGQIPEHCLVRVLDVTVAPGKAYQYRLRIRMANPNSGLPDPSRPPVPVRPASGPRASGPRASGPRGATAPPGPMPPGIRPSLASTSGPELRSDWYNLPATVVVPRDLVYYAVDQKALEPRRKGPHYAERVRPNQAVLQAHRWVDFIPLSGSKRPLAVGAWAVAERLLVFKGEYVGRKERVELPVWNTTGERFVLATDSTPRRKLPGIAVDFSYGQPDRSPPEAIVVDFEGGPQTYDRALRPGAARLRRLTDSSAVEVLLLSPDGKLLARSSDRDTEDPERVQRLHEVRKGIEGVKGAKRPPDRSPFGD